MAGTASLFDGLSFLGGSLFLGGGGRRGGSLHHMVDTPATLYGMW